MRLYSDDFGYDKQADKGIIRLIRKDKLLGVSVLSTMVSPISFKQLTSLLGQKKKLILGLHINLVEGLPTLPFKKVRSLVNKNGYFFPSVIFILKLLFGKIKKVHIQSEIESQLLKLKKLGLKVKMLDSHQHSHAFSPVAEVAVNIARKHNIRFIRNFDSVKTYSLKARIIYSVLKALAFLSYFAAYKKIGIPATWGLKQNFDWTVMSWEGNTFDVASVKSGRAVFVIHPYLPYDTNKSYRFFIK